MNLRHPIIEGVVKTPRHTTSYLSCGDAGMPLVIFVHGWPELALSWRHQLRCFADLGFHAVAPDMRGYGASTVHRNHSDYAIEHIVADMLELLDALGANKAIWVGHDFGGPVVWALASHHPDRCFGVANLSIPYIPKGFAAANLIPLVDRELYPEDRYPAGQWDYQLFYEESFPIAQAWFEANTAAFLKVFFRRGNPAGQGKPSRVSTTRRDGGWFGGVKTPPDLPLDTEFISAEEMSRYVASLTRNGFFGPDSYYMNSAANIEFARKARNDGFISMPVLYIEGTYDYTCLAVHTRLGDPMREHCANLTSVTVEAGHYIAQEKPERVNYALSAWIARQFPAIQPAEVASRLA